jgi:hypothetical protein
LISRAFCFGGWPILYGSGVEVCVLIFAAEKSCLVLEVLMAGPEKMKHN